MPFEFSPGEIQGVTIVDPTIFEDRRGHLMVTYQQDQFRDAGIETEFIQDKQSLSKGGVLRGLHYQRGEHSQAKLVRCDAGEVLDVVVDIRKPSPTFGNYSSRILSEENNRMVYLPRGLAHGFLVLSDTARIHYKIDNHYAPEYEAGIAWDDPTLDIDWPTNDPTVSEKDQQLPTLEQARSNGLLFDEIPRTETTR
ncbi:MAG: dTDP-4-dehydrorhamnose 3,5-epimerase [Halorhabdus sp.]